MARLNRPVTGPDGITRQPGEDHDLPDGLEADYRARGLIEGSERKESDRPEPPEDVKAWNEKSRRENADAVRKMRQAGNTGTQERPIGGTETGAKINPAPAENKARPGAPVT